ncbi:MAG TPA: DUF4129 domain-containing protein [Dehalococcoidia bacterium]|nr:DUF4129 domain-containing protein [Dehalococcoidia bacterium]
MIPRSLAEILAGVMEAIWAFAAIAMFAQVFSGGRVPSLVTLIATVVLAVLVTRLVRSFDFREIVLAAVGGAISLLCIYGLLRIEYAHDLRFWDLGWLIDLLSSPGDALTGQSALVVGTLAVFALWVRWLILVQNKLPPEDVRGSFGIGIVVLAGAVLLRNDLDSEFTVVRLALPYVAVGLIAIAANQQVETGRLGGLSVAGSWGLALLLTLVGIFILAGLAALVPATGLSEPLLPLWRGILIAGGVLLLIMALPFVLITELFLILVPVEGLLGDLPQPEIQPEQLTSGDEEGGGSSFGWVFVSLRVLGGIALIAFVLIVLSSLFLYLRKRTEEEEEKESVAHAGNVLEDLLSLLKGLRPARSQQGDKLPDLSRDGLALRELYLGVLAETERRGAQRGGSMTPRRFAPAIDSVVSSDFGRRLTREFELVRYGRSDITSEQVGSLQREWRQLR